MGSVAMRQLRTPAYSCTDTILGRQWSSAPCVVAPSASASFRVLNWNILAPTFAYEGRYRNIPRQLLEWSARSPLIVQRILRHRLDIVGLQEATCSTFEDLQCNLQTERYSGLYCPKTERHAPDGVAIFWKNERFDLVEERRLQYKVNGFLNKPQVALCVLLADRYVGDARLLVTNTHLLFNAKRGDVKLGQVMMLLHEIWEFGVLHARERVPISTSGDVPPCRDQSTPGAEEEASSVLLRDMPAWVMCGDFNLTPRSCLYEWLSTGKFDFSSVDHEIRKVYLSGQRFMQDEHRYQPIFIETGHGGHGSALHFDPVDYTLLKNRHHWFSGSSRWFHHTIASVPAMFDHLSIVRWVKGSGSISEDQVYRGPHGVGVAGGAEDDGPDKKPGLLYHPLLCSSGYATQDDRDALAREPAVTAYHAWQKGCIDYIWYASNILAVQRILEMPPLTKLREIGDIPNVEFPMSDHFDLVTDFNGNLPMTGAIPLLLFPRRRHIELISLV